MNDIMSDAGSCVLRELFSSLLYAEMNDDLHMNNTYHGAPMVINIYLFPSEIRIHAQWSMMVRLQGAHLWNLIG